ncbi:hypothetical protein [Caenispirillum bisanense]|uniref:hypothetical protein n=1 Tax=Caenispirillum bisanense TaxID=414052 RepID=UPI0031D1520F
MAIRGMGAAAAAAVLVLSAGAALADGMPPEFADPVVRPAPPPVVQAPVQPAPPPPVALVPEPVLPDVPPPPPPFLVTFGESVGYFARTGFESVRQSASFYCAGYGRTAVLDSRFRIGSDWYSRFRCIPSA